MGTELMRVCVKEENEDIPSVPPGFESFASFTLMRVQDTKTQDSDSCSTSITQSVQTGADAGDSIKMTRCLRRKPGVNYGNLDGGSEEECDGKHDQVIAKWRPEDACKPIIEDCPVFYPNEEEFEDTLKYIASIRPRAEPYGICRIVPPSSWKPPFPLKDKTIWETSTFVTRVQRVDKLQNRDSMKKMSKISMRKRRRCTARMGVECATDGGSVAGPGDNAFGFEAGQEFTLSSFGFNYVRIIYKLGVVFSF